MRYLNKLGKKDINTKNTLNAYSNGGNCDCDCSCKCVTIWVLDWTVSTQSDNFAQLQLIN